MVTENTQILRTQIVTKYSFYILIFILLFAGCQRSKEKQNVTSALSGEVVIAADESLRSMVDAQIDIFQSIYIYAKIDCSYLTENDAIKLLLDEKIRLAIVARPLNQDEITFFESKSLAPLSFPIANDAVAVIVNNENAIDSLSIEQLTGILSGKFTNWSQVGGKNSEILQIFDSESSGIIRSLNDSLKLNNKISGHISFAGNSQLLPDLVMGNPNAIAFIGLNLISEKEHRTVQKILKQIKVIAVDGEYPSQENLYEGNYPLIRKIYGLYTDPTGGISKGFLTHLATERGQKITYRIGLKPEFDFQRLVQIKVVD